MGVVFLARVQDILTYTRLVYLQAIYKHAYPAYSKKTMQLHLTNLSYYNTKKGYVLLVNQCSILFAPSFLIATQEVGTSIQILLP